MIKNLFIQNIKLKLPNNTSGEIKHMIEVIPKEVIVKFLYFFISPKRNKIKSPKNIKAVSIGALYE